MNTEEKKVRSASEMSFKVQLLLEEEEARALKELIGYGHSAFLKFFYENLGRTYLQPHEKGLISLFETIGKELPRHIDRIDRTRQTFQQPIENQIK